MTIPTETPEIAPRNRPTALYIWTALAITLVGLLLQMQCLGFQKVIDDNDLVYSVEQRGCGADPIDCFHHPVFQLYYRPLFTATFALRDVLNKKDLTRGRETRWYHAENLVLHAAVCGAAFWFFFLLFQRGRRALLAGLVFTLHPLQVTVTTFIGGRPDSMALLFLLLFSIGAWNSAQNLALPTFGAWNTALNLASPNSSLRRFGWFLLSLFAYTCAVFTKEQCISMLLVLPLLLWRRGYTFPKQNLPLLALYLVPIGLYIRAAKQIIPFNTVSNPHWSTLLHTEMIGRTLWYFERILLFPTVGPIHQSTLGPWDIPQPGVAITGYVLCFLWLAVLWRFRHNPAIRYCALWTSLTLFPCINIIPIPSQFASVYRAAIPLLGFAGLLGVALDKLFEWWQVRVSTYETRTHYPTAYALDDGPAKWQLHIQFRQHWLSWSVILYLVGFYSWETIADVRCWRNNHTLMNAEIYGDPNFIPAYGGQAFGYETTSEWPKVEQQFNMVISAFMPNGPADPTFVAAVKSKDCQRALWSHAGLRYHPVGYLQWILPHRGWARQEQGHFAAAAEDYKRALLLNPKDDNTRANLRNCYLANGQDVEAFDLYRNAFEVPTRSQSDTIRTTPKDP